MSLAKLDNLGPNLANNSCVLRQNGSLKLGDVLTNLADRVKKRGRCFFRSGIQFLLRDADC
jgi:hypothetical protein